MGFNSGFKGLMGISATNVTQGICLLWHTYNTCRCSDVCF